jgi:hypothetical protein
MPLGEAHKKKQGKNLALLFALLALVAGIFGITLVRFGA